MLYICFVSFFFFQAEDGIRDDLVTGVQTCAFRSKTASPSEMKMSLTGLPAASSTTSSVSRNSASSRPASSRPTVVLPAPEIGRASCRERADIAVGGGSGKEMRGDRDLRHVGFVMC